MKLTKKIYSLLKGFIYIGIFILKIILSIPILIVILIISPFLKIKIGELEMRALGHCSITVEIFLSEVETGIHDIKGSKYIWFLNDGEIDEKNKICNYFLLKKWSEKLIIGPRFILEPLFYIFRFLRKIKIGNHFLIPYRHWKDHQEGKDPWQTVDIHNVLPKTKPQIKFTDEEENIGQEYLNKYNLKKNEYLLFFARTNEYRGEIKNTLRDSNIMSQLLGLKKICKEKKLKAVRIGHSPNNKIKSNNKDIIDYSNSRLRTEFLDFYLSFNCKFIVGTGSGICLVPIMNRKKLLMINNGVFSELHHIANSYVPLILPKKFKDTETDRILGYSEVLEKKLTLYEHYPKNLSKYIWVNNTEIEISNAINEMNNYIDNGKINGDENLQSKFWEIFERKCGYKPKTVKVSPSFLRENIDLII